MHRKVMIMIIKIQTSIQNIHLSLDFVHISNHLPTLYSWAQQWRHILSTTLYLHHYTD